MTDTNRIARHEPAAPEARTFLPRVDVTDLGASYELAFDVPGASSVDLSVEHGELELRASVPDRVPAGAAERAIREYGLGDYRRTLALPDDVDVDGLSGRLEHGVLTVTAPKTGRAQPRTITITTG